MENKGFRAFTAAPNSGRGGSKRWFTFAVALVVIADIVFLAHLDTGKQSSLLATWKNNFDLTEHFRENRGSDRFGLYFDRRHYPDKRNPLPTVAGSEYTDSCEDWLEKEDRVQYSRNFTRDPIWVVGDRQDWSTCSVGCAFTYSLSSERKPDASFGLHDDSETASVLRSMESSHYYADNNIAVARGRGYKVIMTTSLSSDVPVGYFSWAEYDIMAPMQPKTEKALAAAFISNCGAHNFRLQALEQLPKHGVPVDSYGGCNRNRDGRDGIAVNIRRSR